jgi:MraZ protein
VERRFIRRSDVNLIVEHMFLGQYQHNIDEKGRLTIPARFRDLLVAQGAYITLGFDQNLMVLAVPSFEQVSKRVNHMSMTDPRARLLKRQIFSNAELVSVDKVGRILIPQFLREAVHLDSEAVVVGAGDYFEIWSPGLWSGQTAQMHDTEKDALSFMDLDLSLGE